VTVPITIDAAAWLGKYLEGADGDTDLARSMLAAFAEALMSAQASMQCGAAYGERTEERENSRNGYRVRPWAPEFLLQPRRRAEKALVAVVCQAYVEGVSTRRVDDLVKALGIEGISSQRCPGWRTSSTPRWPSSKSAPWTTAPTATCGSTRSSSGCARAAGWSTSRR